MMSQKVGQFLRKPRSRNVEPDGTTRMLYLSWQMGF